MPTLFAGHPAFIDSHNKPPIVTGRKAQQQRHSPPSLTVITTIQNPQHEDFPRSASLSSGEKVAVEGNTSPEDGGIKIITPLGETFQAAGMMLSMWEAAEVGNLSSLVYHIRHHYQQGGNNKKLKELLNARNPSTEYTLLHTVFSKQNRDKNIYPILKLLLEHGADVSTPNEYSIYPIHAICMHYHDPYVCLELLLNYKAKPNVRDGDGWTPLHYAARFANPPGPPMKLLIERGANINFTCGSNKTPLFALMANGDYPKTLDWLIHTARADLTIRGECLFNLPPVPKVQTGTVLLQVVKFGRIECLSLLLHSPVAMAQLCRAVDPEEIHFAQHVALQHSKRIKRSHSTRGKERVQNSVTNGFEEDTAIKYNHILNMLVELETLLMDDPTSLLCSKHKDSLKLSQNSNGTKKKHAFSYTTHSNDNTADDKHQQPKLKRTSSIARLKDVLYFKKKALNEDASDAAPTEQKQKTDKEQSLLKSSVSNLLFKALKEDVDESIHTSENSVTTIVGLQ